MSSQFVWLKLWRGLLICMNEKATQAPIRWQLDQSRQTAADHSHTCNRPWWWVQLVFKFPSDFGQCFKVLRHFVCSCLLITGKKIFHNFLNGFQKRNIFKNKRRIKCLINIKIAKFPPIIVRFWLMFWGSLEASPILTFNHNMKHISNFQKRFSETKYLKQSKSYLFFTKMQKRRFDAREALWLAGTLERFVDFF